jgi:hypothetical protein
MSALLVLRVRRRDSIVSHREAFLGIVNYKFKTLFGSFQQMHFLLGWEYNKLAKFVFTFCQVTFTDAKFLQSV